MAFKDFKKDPTKPIEDKSSFIENKKPLVSNNPENLSKEEYEKYFNDNFVDKNGQISIIGKDGNINTYPSFEEEENSEEDIDETEENEGMKILAGVAEDMKEEYREELMKFIGRRVYHSGEKSHPISRIFAIRPLKDEKYKNMLYIHVPKTVYLDPPLRKNKETGKKKRVLGTETSAWYAYKKLCIMHEDICDGEDKEATDKFRGILDSYYADLEANY